MSDTKQCPFCGGEIKAIAKKCKHCGKWIEASYVPQEDINKPLSKTNVSTPQVESNVQISERQNNDVINKQESNLQKTSGKIKIRYIFAGILAFIVIIGLIKIIPNGSPKKISDFESGIILNDKGDSIAAIIAASDWSYDNAAVSSMKGKIKQAHEHLEDHYSKMLSEQAKKLITNERFNEVYMEYYTNYNYEMGSPELRFKTVWYVSPQLDLFRILGESKTSKNPIHLKNKQAKYNKTLKEFVENVNKKGINADNIDSLNMIDLPDFANQCSGIGTLSADAFKELPTEYGEWCLEHVYFTAYLRGEDEKAQIGIQLRPGAILFSCYDLDEAPDGVNIELSESPYDNAYEIYTIPDEKNFKITSEKDINRFLDACEKGQHMKFLFLLEGASHWGWYDFDLKKLKGAKAAYNATNQ